MAMTEWVVVLKISWARDFPMPDEQPVTLSFVSWGCGWRGLEIGKLTEPYCISG